MASRIPDSRFGRAVKAGIPVALIILAVELFNGSWRFNRDHDGVALSWTRTSDSRIAQFIGAEATPTFRIKTCLTSGCARTSLVVSLPQHHLGGDVVHFARTMMGVVTGECPETGKRVRNLAMV